MKNVLISMIFFLGISPLANAQGHHYEITKTSPYFADGAADQVAYINFGDVLIWGWVEITLTGGYSYQNTVGKYTKRYEVGKNPGNGFFHHSSEVAVAFGEVADQWKLGEMERNAQHELIIPIYHLVSTGNRITVNVRGVSESDFDKGLLSISSPITLPNSETRDYSVYAGASTETVWANDGNTIHYGDGNVGIGTTAPDEKLAVNGNIHAKEVRVDLTGWPDYVFKKGYDLPSLEEVQNHINEKGHLPNIPSAKEVAENGLELGEMDKLLLEKIEELTLYTLEQEEEIKKLKGQNSKIENLEQENKKIVVLEKRLRKLEKLLK